LPVVRPPAWLSHQGLFGLSGQERAFAHGLAQLTPPWMQVNYDAQGTGLSGHERADFSLDGMVDELEALVEHLKLPHVVLMCNSVAAMVGIAYTARHPELVSGLIFVNPVTAGATVNMPRLVAALTALAQLAPDERDVAIDAFGYLFASDDPEAPPLAIGTVLRDEARPSTALGLWAAYAASDVNPLLARVRAPTLVLHSRTSRVVHFSCGVQLAARVPGARFLPIDCSAHAMFGDAAAATVQRGIFDFLRDDAASLRSPRMLSGIRRKGGLTPRQRSVLQLIAAGSSSREIADELVLSERTVQRHIANLYAKIGVHNRAEATALALHLQI
jgi:pimeloyl-ACP methyl ester carboxylesterase/DNA-binding CsgD family transcriptional regulator